MIHKPDTEGILLEFESEFNADRNALVEQRAKYFSQQEMADCIGVSIRTIQHFEKGRNYSGLVLTGYRALIEWATELPQEQSHRGRPSSVH